MDRIKDLFSPDEELTLIQIREQSGLNLDECRTSLKELLDLGVIQVARETYDETGQIEPLSYKLK